MGLCQISTESDGKCDLYFDYKKYMDTLIKKSSNPKLNKYKRSKFGRAESYIPSTMDDLRQYWFTKTLTMLCHNGPLYAGYTKVWIYGNLSRRRYFRMYIKHKYQISANYIVASVKSKSNIRKDLWRYTKTWIYVNLRFCSCFRVHINP